MILILLLIHIIMKELIMDENLRQFRYFFFSFLFEIKNVDKMGLSSSIDSFEHTSTMFAFIFSIS